MTPTFSAKDMTVTEGRAALFSSFERLEPTTPTARMLDHWDDPSATPMSRLSQYRLPDMGSLPYDTDTTPVVERGRRSVAPALGAFAIAAVSLGLTVAAVTGSGAPASSATSIGPVSNSVGSPALAAGGAIGGSAISSSPQSIDGAAASVDAARAPSEADATVPSSLRAYFTGGKLVLTGSVPDRRVADALLRRAGSIVGSAAVVDGMVVSPLASMPGDVAVHVAERVRFEPGSHAVSAGYLGLVESWKGVLDAHPSARMVVTGFTDDQGSPDANEKLSEARAHGVADWMLARGLAADRFDVRGGGAEGPVASNDTAAGRAENRRIQVELVGLLMI